MTDAERRLNDLDRHQLARAQTLHATASDRRSITDNMEQLDDALDRTRIQRVKQLLQHPSDLHLDVLGPIRTGAAGRAVWCHQTHRLEYELDHYTGDTATWHQLVHDLRDTRELTRIAEHHIQTPNRNVDPHQWFRFSERATELHAAAAVQPSRLVPGHGLDIG